MSVKSARHELEELINRYGIEGFAIVDDNFIVNRKKVIEICTGVGDLNLKWSALSRVDTVNADVLSAMSAAGCIEIKYGIESGSETILKAMKKNTTRAQIRETIKMTRKLGIGVKAFVIHGFPGENEGTTDETISLLGELGAEIDRVSVFRFVPLPGTFVYQNPQMYGIRGTDQQPDWDGDWEKYHIHHNDRHWWGTDQDFAILNASHKRLSDFVRARWPDRHLLAA